MGTKNGARKMGPIFRATWKPLWPPCFSYLLWPPSFSYLFPSCLARARNRLRELRFSWAFTILYASGLLPTIFIPQVQWKSINRRIISFLFTRINRRQRKMDGPLVDVRELCFWCSYRIGRFSVLVVLLVIGPNTHWEDCRSLSSILFQTDVDSFLHQYFFCKVGNFFSIL